MKCLGMDLGTKTLGLAISDRLGLISSPYRVLRYYDTDELITELRGIIASEGIEVLVLGYPKNMNNTLGEAVKRTEDFKEKLQANFSLPIELIDERLSTVEAENVLLSFDVSRNKRKKVIDSIAASIILDTYLKKIENNKKQETK